MSSVFALVEVNNHVIAILKDLYLMLTENYFNKYTKINFQYVCEQTYSIYRINSVLFCGIQSYLHEIITEIATLEALSQIT